MSILDIEPAVARAVIPRSPSLGRPQKIGIAFLALWILTCVYFVAPEEQAVVTRFGAVIGNRFNGRENLLLVLREDLDNVAVLGVCDLEHIGAVGHSDVESAGNGGVNDRRAGRDMRVEPKCDCSQGRQLGGRGTADGANTAVSGSLGRNGNR